VFSFALFYGGSVRTPTSHRHHGALALALVAVSACATTGPTYAPYLPLGAGQFDNGDTGKGVAFAIGQGVTLTVSAGTWLYLTSHYHGDDVPLRDASRVRGLEGLEIATGVAFFALYTWSVIDALVHAD